MSIPPAGKRQNTPLRLAVIGIGPHFRTRYIDVLENADPQVDIALAVDLTSQENDVRAFFQERPRQPRAFAFIPEDRRNTTTPDVVEHHLTPHVDPATLDAVLICTEPKAKKAFALWACRHGLDIFIDKPVSAFSDLGRADQLIQDFHEINAARQQAGVRIVVSCERRMHPGYTLLRDRLSKLVRRFRVPITHIAITYGGGVWNMPAEFGTRENHPYRYGYGALLHSGYHYADLLTGLADINRVELGLQGKLAPEDLSVVAATPHDLALGIEHGSPIVASVPDDKPASGEIDLIATGSLRDRGRVTTTFSLSVLQHSVAARTTAEPVETFYTQGGMLRQEQVWINLGPLASVHVRSYPYERLMPGSTWTEHFEIETFTNPLLGDGPRRDTIDRDAIIELYPAFQVARGLNVASRKLQLLAFLAGSDAKSSLESHQETTQWITTIYKTLHAGRTS